MVAGSNDVAWREQAQPECPVNCWVVSLAHNGFVHKPHRIDNVVEAWFKAATPGANAKDMLFKRETNGLSIHVKPPLFHRVRVFTSDRVSPVFPEVFDSDSMGNLNKWKKYRQIKVN